MLRDGLPVPRVPRGARRRAARASTTSSTSGCSGRMRGCSPAPTAFPTSSRSPRPSPEDRGQATSAAGSRSRRCSSGAGGDALHVPGEPRRLETPDRERAHIELAPAHAVVGGRGEGVVVVVPPLAERPERDRPSCCGSGRAVANGRGPKAWQIELTEKVAWFWSAIRTSPPQRKPLHPRIRAGRTQAEAEPEEARPLDEGDDRVVQQVAAVALAVAARRPIIQPTWAWSSPSRGLCGSPSRSECAWCSRW